MAAKVCMYPPCGRDFVGRRDAKYCGKKCSNNARNHPVAPAVVLPVEPVIGSVESAVVAALEGGERLSTPLGQVTKVLARRLDQDGESSASLASLARQFEAMFDRAMRGAKVAPDALDELRAKRDARFTA